MPDNKIITDREEMLEAVKTNGSALEYASDTLKADREVVLEAILKQKRNHQRPGGSLIAINQGMVLGDRVS